MVYSNLASMLKLVGRAREGIMCYQNAVALQPGEAEGHANLAAALKDNSAWSGFPDKGQMVLDCTWMCCYACYV